MIVHRFDRVLHWLTPLLVAAVLVVSILLLGLTQRELQSQTERAEQRTERLVGLLEENREEWGPALEESLRMLEQLCDADPDCDLRGRPSRRQA